MSNVEIFLSLFVVFAWVGAIWYVKSFSKKMKALNLDNSNQKVNDGHSMFSNDNYKSINDDITDPSCSYLCYNIYHRDDD